MCWRITPVLSAGEPFSCRKGRMMMLVCHNNDIADGWEEESYKPEFFKKYSEKMCFPIGINIIFYALTN